MEYKVIKVEPKVVKKANSRNLNKKYVECTIAQVQHDSAGNEIAGEIRTTALFDAAAEPYLNCIATANGGNAETNLPIPEQHARWTYVFDQEFVFPEAMVRVNDQGQPELNKFNQMYIRNSVTVMTRYVKDLQLLELNPNGIALAPMKGWDVTSRGTSVMNAFYMPLRLFTSGALQPGAATPAPNPIQQAAQANAAGSTLPF